MIIHFHTKKNTNHSIIYTYHYQNEKKNTLVQFFVISVLCIFKVTLYVCMKVTLYVRIKIKLCIRMKVMNSDCMYV